MYPIGKPVEEIETPSLLLDLSNFQWNIDKMFKFAKEAGVNVRPHAKTFKAAAICSKLLEAGAIGLMTQKLSEAEALLNAGVLYGDKNLLISQELADSAKIERLVGMNVAMGEGKVLTSIENAEEAELLSKAALKWRTKQHVMRARLRWGQKIEFVPSHCCTCINQHDNLFVIKDKKLAAVWPITARGKYY